MHFFNQQERVKKAGLATFNRSNTTKFSESLLRKTVIVICSRITVIFNTIGLLACAIFLLSCAQQSTPLARATGTGCEHVSLDGVLPGITTKEKSYRREQQRNDKKLVPGQKVPEFSLVGLDGEEVALSDVLQEKNTVLIDFWASWCGPCVASFPTLKELRAKYAQDGFEVVAISIDTSHEEWAEGSKKHEIPWINLGELESWDGDVATMYGVHFIPKSYLIDSEGCILQKDLPIDLLEEVVVSRFDKADSEESSLEIDGE
ncbi:MAG: TlpA family protein disulfide reductase [Gammaproteobacteria bacterium]|nr:TlpA family protein disulfide reductase [Gammaproteobacteria bacterium]